MVFKVLIAEELMLLNLKALLCASCFPLAITKLVFFLPFTITRAKPGESWAEAEKNAGMVHIARTGASWAAAEYGTGTFHQTW